MFIKLDEQLNVTTIIYNATAKYNEQYYLRNGFIKVNVPKEPDVQAGKKNTLHYKDGECFWVTEDDPNYVPDEGGDTYEDLEKYNADLLLEMAKKDCEIIRMKKKDEEVDEQMADLLLLSVGGGL